MKKYIWCWEIDTPNMEATKRFHKNGDDFEGPLEWFLKDLHHFSGPLELLLDSRLWGHRQPLSAIGSWSQ